VADVVLRAVGIAAGLVAGMFAVYLARIVPPRMDVESRPRPNWWWAAGIAVAGGFGWFAAEFGWSLLPALIIFGAVTTAVSLIDLDHQLIPNRVLFPGLGIAGACLGIAALIDGAGSSFLRGILAGIVYFAVLLVVAIVARGGFGMGDVKLALLLGLFVGFVGWGELAVAFVLAILLGGVASLGLLLFTRKAKGSKFAYGPYLVAGAWIAIFWGAGILDWYLG